MPASGGQGELSRCHFRGELHNDGNRRRHPSDIRHGVAKRTSLVAKTVEKPTAAVLVGPPSETETP